MSKRALEKVIKNNRVAAIPSRKKEVVLTDANGDTIKDKNGEAVIEKVQLYNIVKLR